MITGEIVFQSGTIAGADPTEAELILVQQVPVLEPDTSILSPDEIEKANRFVKEQDRRSFLWRRATLRQLLSVWLNQDPREITFMSEQHGKPLLVASDVCFNLSRTAGYNVFYFGPVNGGVDVEAIDPARRFRELEQTQLHADEQLKVLTDLDFFTVWTRKEAVLKASGTGITDELWQLNTAQDTVNYEGNSYRLSSYTDHQIVVSFAAEDNVRISPVFFRS